MTSRFFVFLRISLAVFAVFAVVPAQQNKLRAKPLSDHAAERSSFALNLERLKTGEAKFDALKGEKKFIELTKAGKLQILKFSGTPTPTNWVAWQREIENAGGVWLRKVEKIQGALVYAANASVEREIANKTNLVAKMWRDGMIYATGSGPGCGGSDGTDCSFDKQVPATEQRWNISTIKADRLWNKTTGCGVRVCIVDSGADTTNPDLAKVVKGGRNFSQSFGLQPLPRATDVEDESNDYQDTLGHGTHVAGIIAGAPFNGGVVGVAPGVEIYASRVFGESGGADWTTIMDGVSYCEEIGADVINMSLGGGVVFEPLADAIRSAATNSVPGGAVVVVSAGNNGFGDEYNETNPVDNVNFPGNLPEVLTVSASDALNRFAAFSSEGPHVDVMAPGTEFYRYSPLKDIGIYSTIAGRYALAPHDSNRADEINGEVRWGRMSGTSMSAPHVAGAAALLKSAFPEATADEIKDTLKVTAYDAHLPVNRQGAGLVDLQKAYDRLDATF